MEVVKFFSKSQMGTFKKTGVWYVRCPVGKNSIANFMKVISEKAGLSRKYTNHCLRVTAISVLRRNGIDDSDIRSVSRHKTTDGIRPYCTGQPDKQRHRMSNTCMTMTTVVIMTWRLLFQSVAHSQIALCHRLQGCTSHVLLMVWQEAIILHSVDSDLCHHIALLGHNKIHISFKLTHQNK